MAINSRIKAGRKSEHFLEEVLDSELPRDEGEFVSWVSVMRGFFTHLEREAGKNLNSRLLCLSNKKKKSKRVGQQWRRGEGGGGFDDTVTLSADPSGRGSHIAQPIYVAAVNFQPPLRSCGVDGR